MPLIYPVILSGGSGTRLWPKSRVLFPKQFHRLTTKDSLVQEALLRVKDRTLFGKAIIVCNQDHRFMCEEQAKEIGVELEAIVLEPEGRNTAPAVALAAVIVRKLDPDGMLLVLASDHHIADTESFLKAVQTGTAAADAGYICTFGIKPSCPETGYGYIKALGKEVKPGVFQIDSFKEKPNLETAQQYVADPTYLWNSGMFMFSAKSMIQELNQYQPSIIPACEGAVANAKMDLSFMRVSGEHFRQAKAISLDYAIMEPTDKAAVIPLDAQWTDVGSWISLYQTCLGKSTNEAEKKEGNVTVGKTHLVDSKNSYFMSDGPLITAIGVEGLCVVATNDAVLVLPMDRSQDVGKLAKALVKGKDTKQFATAHVSEYKPWGEMKRGSEGSNFKVHTLTINPGAHISYHMHYHRAEHWIVVQGTAMVIRGKEKMMLKQNQSTFIPIGMPHRLSNPGKIPLVVMEVQSGRIMKDDIIRLEDAYGRDVHMKDYPVPLDDNAVTHVAATVPAVTTVQQPTRVVVQAPAPAPAPKQCPAKTGMAPLLTGLGIGIGMGIAFSIMGIFKSKLLCSRA